MRLDFRTRRYEDVTALNGCSDNNQYWEEEWDKAFGKMAEVEEVGSGLLDADQMAHLVRKIELLVLGYEIS